MKTIKFGFLCVTMFFVLPAIGATTKLTTASGYTFKTNVYNAKGEEKNVAVIIMHGKGSTPGNSNYSYLIRRMTRAGIQVFAPKMPWSSFDADHATSMEAIDSLIREASKTGKHVFLAGHSMGATMALHYASKTPPTTLLGVIPIAPGHMIHMSAKIEDATIRSVLKARKLVAEGVDKRKSFTDYKNGSSYSVSMRPSVYLSYYDNKIVQDIKDVLPNVKVAVLWVAGESDRLTEVIRSDWIFTFIPSYPANKFYLSKGDHFSVLGMAVPTIIDWTTNFQTGQIISKKK